MVIGSDTGYKIKIRKRKVMIMNKNLLQKTQEWMQLERKTFEQRQIAEKFYENHLMKLIEEDFIERNKKQVFETVEYLVVSVGTSYEPIVLNIRMQL